MSPTEEPFMLRDVFLAFDDEVRGVGAPAYCSDLFHERLGRFDQTGAFIVVHDANFSAATINLAVTLEHSADGQRWVPKYIDADGFSSTLALWDNATTSGARWGGDDGHLAKLPFLRFAVTASVVGMGTFTSARVRVWIVLRDRGAAPRNAVGMPGPQHAAR
jgi:hypothetical protein